MKKILMLTGAVLLVAGLGLGGVSAYAYFRLHQECAQMVVRAGDKAQTAIAATGTAQEETLKRDADDARKGAMFICEDNRSRKKDYLLAGSGAPVLIVIAAALLFFSRRTSRRLE
jgi:hypothetical protein